MESYIHTQLTETEDWIIVDMLLPYNNEGYPLYKEDITDAAHVLLTTLPIHRASLLRLKDN